jgi:hypothetical protein
MKKHIGTIGRKKRGTRAFTVPEYMVTVACMVVVVGAVLSAYIYGLKMVQFTRPKLEANDEARKTLSLLTEDIRSAHRIRLGTRSAGGFKELPAFSLQKASGIRVHPTTNTNSFVIYYWDQTSQALMRTTNSSAGVVVANSVTNDDVFTGEDWRGNPYTDHNSSLVVGVKLQFYQTPFPKAAGPQTNGVQGGLFDFYQLRTKINKRAYL